MNIGKYHSRVAASNILAVPAAAIRAQSRSPSCSTSSTPPTFAERLVFALFELRARVPAAA